MSQVDRAIRAHDVELGTFVGFMATSVAPDRLIKVVRIDRYYKQNQATYMVELFAKPGGLVPGRALVAPRCRQQAHAHLRPVLLLVAEEVIKLEHRIES